VSFANLVRQNAIYFDKKTFLDQKNAFLVRKSDGAMEIQYEISHTLLKLFKIRYSMV
jgi:hypothetical protein